MVVLPEVRMAVPEARGAALKSVPMAQAGRLAAQTGRVMTPAAGQVAAPPVGQVAAAREAPAEVPEVRVGAAAAMLLCLTP